MTTTMNDKPLGPLMEGCRTAEQAREKLRASWEGYFKGWKIEPGALERWDGRNPLTQELIDAFGSETYRRAVTDPQRAARLMRGRT